MTWLTDISKLAREATPGPYFVADHVDADHYRVAHCGNGCDDKPKIVVVPVQDYCVAAECDAEYIAALTPKRVRALVAVAEAAHEQARLVLLGRKRYVFANADATDAELADAREGAMIHAALIDAAENNLIAALRALEATP